MPDKTNRTTLDSIIKYSSSNVYRRLLGLVNAFIKPKLLSPELFGLWSLLALISSYATYSDLGARVAMRYRIPYHQGRQEQLQIDEVEAAAFHGSLALRMLLVLGLSLAAVFYPLEQKVRIGLLTIAIIVLIQWYHGYFISLLKARQQFNLIANANYIKASVTTFAGIILLFFFNIYGAYLTAILAFIVPLLYLQRRHPLGVPHGFQKNVFISLIRQGFPVMAFNLLILLIGSSDRFLVVAFLGTEQLGYYAIAGMVFGALLQIPGAAREVLEPKLLQSLGEGNDEGFQDYFVTPLLTTAYLMPFMIGTATLLLPPLLDLLLPRYLPAVLPTQIILLGGYFVALAYVTRGIIVAENRQLRAAVLMAIVLGINLLLSASLLQLGYGLIGVAVGSCCSFLLLAAALLLFVQRGHRTDTVWPWLLRGIGWPFCYMLLLLWLCHLLPGSQTSPLWAVLRLAGYSLLMLLPLRFASRCYPQLAAIDCSPLFNKLAPIQFFNRCRKHYGLLHTLRIEARNLLFLCNRYLLRRPLLRRKIHGFQMDLSTTRKGISKSLYLFGTREEDHRIILEEELQPGDRVLDIGANIGYYALLEASLTGRSGQVIAIEPDPLNLELLQRNVTLNGWQQRIEIRAQAVSDRSGRRTLQRARKSNCNYLTDENLPENAERISVETVAIDQLLLELPPIKLIRMDLEGQEVDIFRGLVGLIATAPDHAPQQIIFEAHPERYAEPRWDMRSQLEQLFDHGYRVKRLVTADDDNSPPREHGYRCQRIASSDFHHRGIYHNISNADALLFICQTTTVRTVLLERKGTS
ncbi:MAG TPA: FkbM family methyltransferase [Malonomonas sp.]